MGPSPPRAPKAPFGTLGHPGVPLGPLGSTPRDRHLVEATERRLESLVEEQALPERVSQVGGTAHERKELYFEQEGRPAGAFWPKYLIGCESEVACNFLKKKSQKALNHVLIG